MDLDEDRKSWDVSLGGRALRMAICWNAGSEMSFCGRQDQQWLKQMVVITIEEVNM